jgi:ABC-2 type transport system permease protein
MAGMSLPGLGLPSGRGQIAAIAALRWQAFRHSLRTTRGSLQLAAGIFNGLMFGLGGLGGAVGMGGAAWYFTLVGETERLPALLWPVFFFWQFFPLATAAFSKTLDAFELLRFPLNYRAYVLTRITYGALDPATLVGCLWLLGITAGIGLARRSLLWWAVPALLGFALLNVLLTQTIFAWAERWLAQRRTREIFGILFFVLIIGVQFIGPLVGRYGEKSGRQALRVGREVAVVQRALPPGLAGGAISDASKAHFAASLGSLALLGGYGIAITWLLNLRLRAQYRGESLSETAARGQSREKSGVLPLGWALPGLSAPVAAVFEKEMQYLWRSGPMLFTLIMPAVLIVLFGLGPAGSEGAGFLARAPAYAFPVGAVYALLMLTNLVYNNFGGDGGGVQFFFAAPVRIAQIVLAKNLVHGAVLILELALVWIAVCMMFRPPSLAMTIATLTGVLFAVPVNLVAGNLLSLYSPKKIESGMLGRQRASQTTVLASFAIQLGTAGLCAFALYLTGSWGSLWLATAAFLVLAVAAWSGYALVLNRIDRIALGRREVLISELCRA